jgi:hypothetical protein
MVLRRACSGVVASVLLAAPGVARGEPPVVKATTLSAPDPQRDLLPVAPPPQCTRAQPCMAGYTTADLDALTTSMGNALSYAWLTNISRMAVGVLQTLAAYSTEVTERIDERQKDMKLGKYDEPAEPESDEMEEFYRIRKDWLELVRVLGLDPRAAIVRVYSPDAWNALAPLVLPRPPKPPPRARGAAATDRLFAAYDEQDHLVREVAQGELRRREDAEAARHQRIQGIVNEFHEIADENSARLKREEAAERARAHSYTVHVSRSTYTPRETHAPSISLWTPIFD